MIKNRWFAVIFRGICFLVILAGLLLHLEVFEGQFAASKLMYYTIQSNILALVLFGVLLYKSILGLARDGKTGEAGYFPRFEMVVVIDLMLTLVVFWVLLAPGMFTMGDNFGMWSFGNLSVHLFAPLFCLADYILFAPPRHLKYRDVYAVLIFPLSYALATSIAGFLGYVYRVSPEGVPVRFPYFFFDWDQVGAYGFLYIAGLVVFFIIITHGLYLLDRKWKKPALLAG